MTAMSLPTITWLRLRSHLHLKYHYSMHCKPIPAGCERQVPMITCKQLCQKAIMPGYWHNPHTLFKQQLVTYSPTIAIVHDTGTQSWKRILQGFGACYFVSKKVKKDKHQIQGCGPSVLAATNTTACQGNTIRLFNLSILESLLKRLAHTCLWYRPLNSTNMSIWLWTYCTGVTGCTVHMDPHYVGLH